MHLNSIFGFPASILLLIASHSVFAGPNTGDEAQIQWQQNVSPRTNNFKDSGLRRRLAEEHLRLGRSPVGVMKMSSDEGEKFYMEYWQFEESSGQSTIKDTPLRERDEEIGLLVNGTSEVSFRPPFLLHTGDQSVYQDLRARGVLAILKKKDFSCPAGTAACTAIGYPNSCCATNENCFIIQDTGLGPVGCCPNGSACGGTITTCNAPNTACAANLGGGCCIPNYICQGIGCVFNSTVAVSQAITSPTPSLIVVPTTSSASTSIVVIPTTSATTTTTSIQQTYTTRSISPTSTMTGVAPVRPTYSTSVAPSSPSTTSTATDTSCPVAFYACSATYGGGCCRTGRNCDTTSCPPVASSTIISGGETIIVPVGSAATVASPSGTCASAWSSCAASEGGNCCPSGFQCGTASCTSTSGTAVATRAKESTNSGMKKGVDLIAYIGVLMVALATL